jgi:hypothetical protein
MLALLTPFIALYWVLAGRRGHQDSLTFRELTLASRAYALIG